MLVGRSSSPVGYGIGIAEAVGSNPTRSTFLPKSVCVRFQWKMAKMIVLLYHLQQLHGIVHSGQARNLSLYMH